MRIDSQYGENLHHYQKRDGMTAIAVYIIVFALAFFRGWVYTTNVSVSVLNASQMLIPAATAAVFLGFLALSKQKISSIGLHAFRIATSILWGIAGSVGLLAIQVLLSVMQGMKAIVIAPVLLNWIIFIICAFEEEIIFRGYIQTRLSGLIRMPIIAEILNAVLFLLIHYPVKWVALGMVSFSVISGIYVVLLLLLHFFCDMVYKKTNCLWGAIVLHIIYNAVGAMIVFQ